MLKVYEGFFFLHTYLLLVIFGDEMCAWFLQSCEQEKKYLSVINYN